MVIYSMSSVLKERRKDLGREISDIAQVTRIKGSYLRAIEDEDYEKLPVEVYTRGYIKEYAEFLGIPPGTALNPYEKFLESKKAAKGKEHAAEKPLSAILQKESSDDLEIVRKIALSSEEDDAQLAFEEPKKSIASGKMLLALIVVVVAAIVYDLIPRQGNIPIPPPQQEQPAKAPETAPQANPPATETKTEANGAPGTNGAGGTVPAPPQGQAAAKTESGAAAKKKYNVDITATGRTWVQAVMDGSERREVMLNPGDKASFSGNKVVLLKIGNAAGVVLNYNGKELRNLGKEGEVVTINLPTPKPAQPAAPKKPAEAPVNKPAGQPAEKKTPVTDKPEANTPEADTSGPSNP